MPVIPSSKKCQDFEDFDESDFNKGHHYVKILKLTRLLKIEESQMTNFAWMEESMTLFEEGLGERVRQDHEDVNFIMVVEHFIITKWTKRRIAIWISLVRGSTIVDGHTKMR